MLSDFDLANANYFLSIPIKTVLELLLKAFMKYLQFKLFLKLKANLLRAQIILNIVFKVSSRSLHSPLHFFQSFA